MTHHVRDINQQFWHSDHVAHLTIRATQKSTQGYKSHSHPELSIGLIESGSTCLSMDSSQLILKEGDAILIAPHKVHACNPLEEKTRSYLMLYIDSAWCCNVLSALYGHHVSQFNCDATLLTDSIDNCKLLNAAVTLMGDPSKQDIDDINAQLYRILSHYCSPFAAQPDEHGVAGQVKQKLLDDITNPPSISHIAQQLGRTSESLIRHFKRRFGITPKSFLNNHRIETAKLLLKSGMNIVDVANEVGFSDQSQLHRAFVSYTASTPRQFQQVTVNFRQE